MITLITGVPGSGKTLYMLNLVKEYAEKNPGRHVYYSGIRDLTLPWTNIGGYIKDEATGQTLEVIPPDAPVQGGGEWFKLPIGSIVVIDECQNYFRTRGQGQTVPQMVSELETHRHRGFDIFILTQHPMLIDNAVRRMTERHFHCVRWFGLGRSTVHEFQGVKIDVEKNRNSSIRHEFKYPKAAFGWYKSAEVHTVKSRVPARVYFIAVVPILIIVCGYFLYDRMAKYATKDGASSRVSGVVPDAPSTGAKAKEKDKEKKPMTAAEYGAAFSPRVSGLPHTAPAFDKALEVVFAPTPSACVKSAKKCSCFTDQGTVLDTSQDVCESIVSRGFFQYWKQPEKAALAPPQAVSIPADGSRNPQASPAAVVASADVLAVPEPVFVHSAPARSVGALPVPPPRR